MKKYSVLLISVISCASSFPAPAACQYEVPVSPYDVQLFTLPLCSEVQFEYNSQVRSVGLGVNFPAGQHVEMAASARMSRWGASKPLTDEIEFDTAIRVGSFAAERYFAEAGLTLSDWFNAEQENDWFVGAGVGYTFQHLSLDLTLRVRQISDDYSLESKSYYRTALGVALYF